MSIKKSKMDVLKVGKLNDFKAFKEQNVINFTKRAGGQVFQYYSLLDSYAQFLGAEGDSDFSSSYLETEVIFSREIFKKYVYSSVILPLYTSDSSTNKISMYASVPGSYVEHSFFKPQLTPSWYDRHTNTLEFLEGTFRNVYKKASAPFDSMLNKSISFLEGEFRLPLLNYRHREVESITNTGLTLTEIALKKVLLKALIPTESIQAKTVELTTLAKSTINKNDTLELNFIDINYPLESPKARVTHLDKFSTKVSVQPEPSYMKILSKRGGIRLDFDNSSMSISSYYDWSINFDFQPKELRVSSYILDYSPLLIVRLDDRDYSKLVVSVDGKPLYTSPANKISINNWYNLSIEKKGPDYLVYLDRVLLTTITGATKTFFDLNGAMVLGNSKTTYDGFIGNLANFLIIKNTCLISDGTYDTSIEGIKPIIGSELDFSTDTILDKNTNVIWNSVNNASYDVEAKGISFSTGQYIYAYETPDVSIYNFNNFKIDLVFNISSNPTLVNPIRTLVHKTGAIEEDGATYTSGYSISVQRVDESAKLLCNVGSASLLSSTTLKVGIDYHVEVIKYKNQLLLFINNAFDGSLILSNAIGEDTLSKLILGRYQTRPERDFKGVLKSFKLTNFFRDTTLNNKLLEYFPENLEYEDILNFEEELLTWKFSNPTTSKEFITNVNPKFGQGALKLDNTHNYITRPSTPIYNFKQKDFTIEGWYKPSSFTTEAILLSNGVNPTDPNYDLLQYLYIDSQGFVKFYYNKTNSGLGTDTLIKSTTTLTLNVWTHIVFERANGVFKIYLNGKLSGEEVANGIDIDFSINDTYIGNNNSNVDSTKTQFQGTMDSIRITKDEAVYGGTLFIPPTEAFGDSNNSVIANLSFDGQYSEGSTNELLLEFNPTPSLEQLNPVVINPKTFEDYDSNYIDKVPDHISWDFNNSVVGINALDPSKNITLGGSSQSLYETIDGKTSYNLDTSGRIYIPAANSDLLNFGDKDFTLEFWLYKVRDYYNPSSPGSYNPILVSGTTDYLGLMSSETKLLYTSLGNSSTVKDFTVDLLDSNLLPTKAWFNLTLCKVDKNFLVFVDGHLLNSVILPEALRVNFNFSIQGNSTQIGRYETYANYYPGKIDKLRITKGLALYTKDYDVSKVYDTPKLSFPFQLETSTTLDSKKLYGDQSIKFNNSGILTNNSSSTVYTPILPNQDFTFEFYMQFENNTNRYQTILSNVIEESNLTQYFSIYRYGETVESYLTNRLALTTNPNNLDDVLYLSDQQLLDNVWYNITITRVDGVLKLFINGMLDNRVYLPNLSVVFTKVGLRLGNSIIPNTGLSGYLDSFRYTPKLSIYRDSFNPENEHLTIENSEAYIKTENFKGIYESISKKTVTSIDNINTELKDGNLITKLPENVSKTGITIPKTDNRLITTQDFTIELKVFLESNRSRRWTQVFCNRDSADASATYLEISSNSEVDGIALQSAIRFLVRPFSISLDFGRKSFIEDEWNTIAITRQGNTLRGYCNGILKATADLSTIVDFNLRLNTYTGFKILDSGQTNEGRIDYLYMLKDKSLLNETAYLPKTPTVRHDFYKERFSIASTDNKNTLPSTTFVENLYTKEQQFSDVVTKDSLLNSSLEVNGNTYIKLNSMPKVPKDFKISFWIQPTFFTGSSNNYYSVFKWTTLDEYEINYSINSQGKDELSLTKGTLSNTIGTYNKTGMSLIPGEWNNVIITKYENTVAIYINGYRLILSSYLGYSEMTSNTLSDVTLGYNSTLPTDSIRFLYDEVRFLKYREGETLGLYYDSLGNFLETTNHKYSKIPLVNSDASNGTEGWKNSGNIESKLVTSLSKYYFKHSIGSSSWEVLSQRIDVSEYLDISSNKLLLSWTQSYDNLYYTSDNLSGCDIHFYSKEELELGSFTSSKINPYTEVSVEREMERYNLTRIPIGTAYIEIRINLKYYSYITNLELYIENLGNKFESKGELEDYIEPLTQEVISHSLILDDVETTLVSENSIIATVEGLEAVQTETPTPQKLSSIQLENLYTTNHYDTMIINIKED